MNLAGDIRDHRAEGLLRASAIGPATLPGGLLDTAHVWAKALRLHHWAKNLLLFVPLFLGHIAGDGAAWQRTIIAFLAFGLVTSATYLLNDLNDMEADRRHPAKRSRAIAAGRIRRREAAIGASLLLAAGLTAAWCLSRPFAGTVIVYLILTTAYSLRLKREALVDVAVIGGLFTLRLLMGALLNHLTPSPWMLSFGAFFFVSLSLAKRHAELMKTQPEGRLAGRGYRHEDWPLTLAFGIGCGLASIVVMLQFIALETQVSGAYRSPNMLVVAPICMSLWLMRIWLFSHRTTLDDDPVLFAFKDWPSYALGAVTMIGWTLAI